MSLALEVMLQLRTRSVSSRALAPPRTSPPPAATFLTKRSSPARTTTHPQVAAVLGTGEEDCYEVANAASWEAEEDALEAEERREADAALAAAHTRERERAEMQQAAVKQFVFAAVVAEMSMRTPISDSDGGDETRPQPAAGGDAAGGPPGEGAPRPQDAAAEHKEQPAGGEPTEGPAHGTEEAPPPPPPSPVHQQPPPPPLHADDHLRTLPNQRKEHGAATNPAGEEATDPPAEGPAAAAVPPAPAPALPAEAAPPPPADQPPPQRASEDYLSKLSEWHGDGESSLEDPGGGGGGDDDDLAAIHAQLRGAAQSGTLQDSPGAAEGYEPDLAPWLTLDAPETVEGADNAFAPELAAVPEPPPPRRGAGEGGRTAARGAQQFLAGLPEDAPFLREADRAALAAPVGLARRAINAAARALRALRRAREEYGEALDRGFDALSASAARRRAAAEGRRGRR